MWVSVGGFKGMPLLCVTQMQKTPQPPFSATSLIPAWLSTGAVLHCRHNYLVKINR